MSLTLNLPRNDEKETNILKSGCFAMEGSISQNTSYRAYCLEDKLVYRQLYFWGDSNLVKIPPVCSLYFLPSDCSNCLGLYKQSFKLSFLP